MSNLRCGMIKSNAKGRLRNAFIAHYLHFMNNIKKLALVSFIFLVGIVPLFVFAVGSTPVTGVITSITDVESVLTGILGWVNTFFYLFATAFIIIAAFFYLTAQGEPEKVKKAKSMLIYAIVAIVIALLAGGMTDLIKGILKSPTV